MPVPPLTENPNNSGNQNPSLGGTPPGTTDFDTLTDAQKEELYNQQQDAMNEGHGATDSEQTKRDHEKLYKKATVMNSGYNDVPIVTYSDDQLKDFVSSMCNTPSSRKYQPLKYNKRYDNKTKTGEKFSHRKYADKYSLRLGDSLFSIPPEFITVSETSQTVREASIRSTTSLKKKYGYSATDVTIRIMFNGDDQINGYEVDSPFDKKPYYVDGLRPLLAQARVTPIMPVENEFLNRTCGMFSIIIQNIQIKTVPGFPKLLECTIMALEFDSSSYTMIPIWEYGNIIEWDLYRYNYQRLLSEYVPATIASPVEGSYKLAPVKDFTASDKFEISMPDDTFVASLDADELEDVVMDVKKMKYKTLLTNQSETTSDFVVIGMSFGFENIVVSPKLSSSNKATTQYLGGGDSMVQIQIITTDEYIASEFKSLMGRSQYLIRKLKGSSGIGFVRIDNAFTNLIGSSFLLLDSVTVETVPNFPGTFSVTIEATSNDVHSSTAESLNGFRPFWDNRKGEKSDAISQDASGLFNKISQDIYTEYKMNELDLYPDLYLPNYDEVDHILPLINAYRQKNGMKVMPLSKYPRRVAANTLYGQPYVMENRVDPDYYFMYPGLDFSKVDISSIAGNTDVVPAGINHVYQNVVVTPGTDSPPGGGGGGAGDSENDTLLNAPSSTPSSCSELDIKCSRDVDRVFLDYLLAKLGCAYVFGANGQYVYARSDPRWTAANEKRLNDFGGPVLDRWRTGVQAFDCSGFVGYGMHRCGYFTTVPRLHHTVFRTYCTSISKSELRPGDILTNDHHIAVYIGSGKTVEAMGKDWGVCIGDLANRFSWFGRCNWTPEIIAECASGSLVDGNGNAQVPIRMASPMSSRTTTQLPGGGSSGSGTLGKFGGDFDRYDPLIEGAALVHSLNGNWIKALMKQESGMNPTAGSSAGARGLLQLTSICCAHLGIPYGNNLHDPAYNIEWGCVYLKQMVDKYGSYKIAVGAYNCGPGRMDSYVKGGRPLPGETTNHMNVIEKNYNELIANGGKPVTGDQGAGSGSGDSGTPPVTPGTVTTSYVKKAHGDKIINLNGKFGVPIIMESPVNALFGVGTDDSVLTTHRVPMAEARLKFLEKKAMFSELTTVNNEIQELKATVKASIGAPETPVVTPGGDTAAQEASTNAAYHEQVNATTDRDNTHSLLASTIDECTYGCRGTMLKAFPTFAFMISTDTTQWLDAKKMWNNYYPYRAIMGMSVTHDHEQPMGTAYIKASNLSQNLTRRPKIDFKDIGDDPEYSGLNKHFYEHYGFILGTPKVTQTMVDSHNNLISEMKLSAGARVHIRMGYGNSFGSLPVIFNGTVAEVTTGEYLEIIAQSDGAELINGVVSAKPDKTNGIMQLQKEPSNIITSLLIDRYSWTNQLSAKWGEASEYNIEHFGLFTGKNRGGVFNNRELEYDLCKNVYVGTYSQTLFCAMPTGDPFDGEDGVEFFIYNKTPWDTMNLTAQTLPEFVAYPMYNMFDSNLFFGVPSWLCKYRYDIDDNLKVIEYSKSFSQIHLANMNDIIDNRMKVSSKFLTTNAICTYVLGNDAETDVECSPTMYADRTIDWSKQKTKVIDTTLQQNYFGPDSFYELLSFNRGVTNAESVAVTALIESFSKSYYDEIIMLGNPTIKPYDELFIDDMYGEVYGLTRVNRVVHSINSDTGFTTSVTPGMLAYSKSEDSGSSNNYRNKVNLMDVASAILGGRFRSSEIVSRYKPIVYDDELSGGETCEYMLESVLNLTPITNSDAFSTNLKAMSAAIHGYARTEYIEKLVSQEYMFKSDTASVGRDFSRYLSRLAMLRPVLGYFVNGNCIGIRPVLHKNRPFVAGVKGAEKLIDGYSNVPDYQIDE